MVNLHPPPCCLSGYLSVNSFPFISRVGANMLGHRASFIDVGLPGPKKPFIVPRESAEGVSPGMKPEPRCTCASHLQVDFGGGEAPTGMSSHHGASLSRGPTPRQLFVPAASALESSRLQNSEHPPKWQHLVPASEQGCSLGLRVGLRMNLQSPGGPEAGEAKLHLEGAQPMCAPPV